MVGLDQLARHTGRGHVRDERGAEGGGDADTDERSEARSVFLRLYRLRDGGGSGGHVAGGGAGSIKRRLHERQLGRDAGECRRGGTARARVRGRL